MTNIVDLLALPVSTLVVLAAGYIGYRIAFVGHDAPHGPVDTVFLSFTFSAIAALVMWLLEPLNLPAAILAAVGVTLLSAITWRVLLAPMTWAALRKMGVSDHDRGRTVWESMLMRRLRAPTRIVVTTANGRQMMCSDLIEFDAAPLGPCLLGPDGSIGLYVTDARENNQCDWSPIAPYEPGNEAWGYSMTFVPTSQIARVSITRPN